MKSDEILRMAREATAYAYEKLPVGKFQPERPDVRDLRFAALVAAYEREQCARVCESMRPSQRIFDHRWFDSAEHCANAIRARSEQ